MYHTHQDSTHDKDNVCRAGLSPPVGLTGDTPRSLFGTKEPPRLDSSGSESEVAREMPAGDSTPSLSTHSPLHCHSDPTSNGPEVKLPEPPIPVTWHVHTPGRCAATTIGKCPHGPQNTAGQRGTRCTAPQNAGGCRRAGLRWAQGPWAALLLKLVLRSLCENPQALRLGSCTFLNVSFNKQLTKQVLFMTLRLIHS